jgi:hypothetical protein
VSTPSPKRAQDSLHVLEQTPGILRRLLGAATKGLTELDSFARERRETLAGSYAFYPHMGGFRKYYQIHP